MSNVSDSSPRLTDEQRLSIGVRGTSVALTAGAGCGKTTVLTGRFLEELEGASARPLSELVALTFTEKAARELRLRIRALCRARLEAGAGHDVGRWRTVLRALEAAPIGTIHQFCGNLLRDHALELDLDPDFTVLEPAIAGSLRDRAVQVALRHLLAEDNEDLIDLAIEYGLGAIKETLEKIVTNRSAAELEAWTSLTTRQIADHWLVVWERKGRPLVLRRIAAAALSCRETLTKLQASHPKLIERRRLLMEHLQVLESGMFPVDHLTTVRELAKVNDLKGKDVWPSTEAQETIKHAFKALRDEIDKVLETHKWDEETSLDSAGNSLRLLRLAGEVRREYQRIKRERQGLDFDDLLAMTATLLRDRPEAIQVRRADGSTSSIGLVMIDEFQDTDRVQAEILAAIGGEEFLEGRMFVVGDVRQSIYRFRGAEPSIFADWRNRFPEQGRLSLRQNYRSVPDVIHFVNALFLNCFAGLDGDQADGQVGHQRLSPVRTGEAEEPAVAFLWAMPPTDLDDDRNGVDSPGAHECRINEARCLARWLSQRLKTGWTILDRKTRVRRDAHAGDVAFLFRAMTDVGPYEAALAEHGFDYHTIGGSAFFAQQEVHDVINVLSVIEDPLDELSLAGALRSPFFSLSDDGLYALARRIPGGLPEGLERAGEISDLNAHDRRQAVRAGELLGRWRGIKDRTPIAELVASVLGETGFAEALVCEFLGSRKLANARKLERMAREYDRQGGFTLGDFVSRIRADMKNTPREEQASTTEEDSSSVRLMSIHQAKGLEFPIVVIPDLNRKSPNRSDLVSYSADFGLVIRPAGNPPPDADGDPEPQSGISLGSLAFRVIEQEEEHQEALRLFYVASTRARDFLVLSSGLADPPKPVSPMLELLWNRFDWREGRCLSTLPDSWPLPKVQVFLATPPEVEEKRKVHSSGLSTSAIERIITDSRVREPESKSPRAGRPAFVDLEAARGLPPRTARLDRLIRAVVAEPDWLRAGSLAEACARAGAVQRPLAGSRLVAEAIKMIEPLLRSPLFAELRESVNTRGERDREWTFTWRSVEQTPVVIHGCCDAIYRDAPGRWRSVIVTGNRDAEEIDRIRLMFGNLALDQSGLDPLGPAWWVRPGPDGLLAAEIVAPADPVQIDRFLDRWLSAMVT